MRHALIPLLLVLGTTACGDKKGETGPPTPNTGWNEITEEGADGPVVKGHCYYPPAWEELGSGDRRMTRQKVLEAMMNQWYGKKDEAVKFDKDAVMELETVLLGKPELIERVAKGNYEKCMESWTAGSTVKWEAWIKARPGKLTEGECQWPPLDYTLFQPLEVTKGWQVPVNVCAGDRVHITASAIDQYRISKDGKWINAEGDSARPASRPSLPCNWEGCFEGQLIMRFTSEDGAETILPVGTDYVYDAPGHGTIMVQINDDEWFDNEFKEERGVIHHTTIEYSPAE